MAARRQPALRVTAELLAFHKANARRLRAEACGVARQALRRWLARLFRRR
ncbi:MULTISPECIES: hypothetical protein [Rhodopseudomonas]|nr:MULTISPECIES: hypothetical protein [Rhodopseudomonas]MDF3810252.1 hypothetical protein [Rhodopseudomonas sp. BAL398]WOK15717.1 hypothetical protein RBJ75_16195 [Rhodopseudomonas sp. BAL398]